jgi:hypothetical protein
VTGKDRSFCRLQACHPGILTTNGPRGQFFQFENSSKIKSF